jgi:cytochrome c-type biogenesis protein CcmF
MLSWKRANLWPAIQRLWVAALIALACGVLALALQYRGPIMAPFGIALGAWLIAGSLVELADRVRLFRAPLATTWHRLKGLPGQSFGMTLAHLGVGVMVIGIVSITAWREEVVTSLQPNASLEVAGTTITYLGETPLTGPNYTATVARFKVEQPGKAAVELTSEKRIFLPGRQPTTEVGILPTWLGDIYVALGDKDLDGARIVRAYFNPLVTLIWIGSVIMFIGGMFSMADRRHRVGAPRRSKGAVPQPAE